jgi:hypothetical protein
LLSDHAAERQERPIAIEFGKRLPKVCQRNLLIWLQRARGGTGRGSVCRMAILHGTHFPGESGSNPPISGVPRLQLWCLAPRIDNAELQVRSVCFFCNRRKGPNLTSIDPETDRIVPLFNPRQDTYSEHFARRGNLIVGLTTAGRATVFLLAMNSDQQVEIRSDRE